MIRSRFGNQCDILNSEKVNESINMLRVRYKMRIWISLINFFDKAIVRLDMPPKDVVIIPIDFEQMFKFIYILFVRKDTFKMSNSTHLLL
jgi:hypothetical protein